jgi:hypothetical protein
VELHGILTEHILTGACSPGDICNVYLARSDFFGEELVKIARSPDDADLMLAELGAVHKLRTRLGGPWQGYFPDLVDYSVLTDGQLERKANIFARLDSHHSLEQIRTVLPQGVPLLNALWIWRRMLTTLFLAHDQEIIHGAVLPCHVMINPEQVDCEFSRVVLVDWCYSQPMFDDDSKLPRIKAVVPRFHNLYAPEVLDGSPASPATDIYMAAQTFIYLLGDRLPSDTPSEIKAYFRRCLDTQNQRPSDAKQLQRELDEILQKLGFPYYDTEADRRIFRPFPYQPSLERN